MSEEIKRKTTGSGSGRSSGSNSSKSGSSKGSSTRSGSPGGSPKSSSTRSASSGSSSKSNSARSASSGGSSRSGSSKGSPSRSSSSGGSTKKSTSGGSKAKGGSSSRTSGGSASGKKSGTQTKRTGGTSTGTKKRSSYDDIPYNPRRDSQDERDLRNSPSAKRIADERRRRTYNKNRRLYNFMFYAAITVAVISVVVILSVTVLFNISTITVEKGENVPYTDEEILAACGIEPGDNLFAIDAEQAALDVTTGLPYIEVCNISRKLPSTLELDVRAVVVLGSVTTTDGAYIMLSASGRALQYADAYTGQPAARINGMNMAFDGIGMPTVMEDTAQLDVAAELVVGYSLYGLTLDSITFESAGTVSVSYDERIKINIGVPTNLSQKIQVSASMISEGKIAKNESGTLDMSIDERAVFTPDYLTGTGAEGDL